MSDQISVELLVKETTLEPQIARPPSSHNTTAPTLIRYTRPPFPTAQRLLATTPRAHTRTRTRLGFESEYITSHHFHTNTMNLASSSIRKKQIQCLL